MAKLSSTSILGQLSVFGPSIFNGPVTVEQEGTNQTPSILLKSPSTNPVGIGLYRTGDGVRSWNIVNDGGEVKFLTRTGTNSFGEVLKITSTGSMVKTGNQAGYIIANQTSRTMLYSSTTLGEHIFGGNNDGSAEVRDYIRVGVNKLQYQTNNTVYAIYHEGNKQTTITGNAGTATKLQTARAINGVAFDGSKDITISDSTKLPHFKHTSISDLNNMQTTGIYSCAASSMTNAATANHGTVIVDFNVGTPYQIWIPDNSNIHYKRTYNKSSATWGSWSSTLGNSITGNASTATKLATARRLTIGSTGKTFDGTADVAWTLSEIGAATASHTHSNYVPTTDYTLTTISKTLTLTTSWTDTGITGTNLATGSYMVQISGMSASATSLWGEIFTGTMSWTDAVTNSTDYDEIILHKAGHASNGRMIYLRTIRSPNSGYLKLQIAASHSFSSSNYTFKFRKLI